MKRLARVVLIGSVLAFGAIAQESAEHTTLPAEPIAGHEKAPESEPSVLWKWANFAILAIALGYLIRKSGPAFFKSRTEEIQRGIAEAAALRKDAEARAAKVELRMQSLQSEIEQLRADARSELEKEAGRIRKDTEQQFARVQSHGEQEVKAIAKHAKQELQAHAADLAVQLAEQRVRNRMDSATQHSLVEGFLRHLDTVETPEARR